MYIHRYQINRVIDAYRKHLSRIQGIRSHRQAPDDGDDRSGKQSLIDQVAADIVERIAQAGPQYGFPEPAAGGHPEKDVQRAAGGREKKAAGFTYTAIDENNRKISNTMPIEKLNPLNDDK